MNLLALPMCSSNEPDTQRHDLSCFSGTFSSLSQTKPTTLAGLKHWFPENTSRNVTSWSCQLFFFPPLKFTGAAKGESWQLFPNYETCHTLKVWEAAKHTVNIRTFWTTTGRGGNISKTSLEKDPENKKVLNWEEEKNSAIKFGSLKFLLSFSLFRKKKNFLCREITIKYFLIFVTPFATWRILIMSKITLKIKLLLLFWRWAFFKLLFCTRAMTENVKILCWQSHKPELLQKLFSVTSTWQVPYYPTNYCPENNFLGLFWLP